MLASDNKPLKQTAIRFGWLLCLLLPALSLRSQSPAFKALIDIREAIVGAPFEVTFTLFDGEGQRFSPPAFRDFKPQGIVSESRGMSIINGKTSSKQSWTYTLVAAKTGTFTLGPATVVAGGKTLSSNTLTIKVLSAPAAWKGGNSLPPAKDDQVFITSSLSSSKVHPGQQVTWRLTLYTRTAIEGADLIALPDFEGFYSKEKRRFDTRTQYQTIRGKQYAVKVLHEEALFPQSTGELTIGPAQIRVGLEQPGAQGFLFGTRPVTLSTQPVTLNVTPLPDPAPAGFTGGVGKFEWEVSADTAALTTDDALTITVSLRGNGDARRFAPPRITAPEGCEIYEPRVLEEEEYENEAEVVATKKLEYVVLPKEPGSREIIPQLVYYDPDSSKYCTLTAAPIRFDVTAGKNYQPNDAAPLPAEPVAPQPEITWKDRVAAFFMNPWLWAALLIPLLGYMLILLYNRRKKTAHGMQISPAGEITAAEPLHYAPPRTFKSAVLPNPGLPPQVFYNELLKALQAFISAKLNLMPAQLNQAELRVRMTERRITPIRAQAFLSLMQTCEQAVYSGHADPSKVESDWQTAQTILQELEKEMQ